MHATAIKVAALMSKAANHTGNQPWLSLDAASWWFDKSSIVLAVSLFIGFVCTVMIIITGIAKEHHWDLLRESASKQIASLELETAKANEGASQANARAAEAQLALEKFKQPRALGLDRSDELAKLLSEFAGTRFDASVVSGDPEAIIFLSEIAATLEMAKWNWVAWGENGPFQMVYRFEGTDKPAIGQLGHFGVSVLMNPDDKETLDAPASALVKAIAAAGFEASKITAKNENASTKNAVHIVVGRKR